MGRPLGPVTHNPRNKTGMEEFLTMNDATDRQKETGAYLSIDLTNNRLRAVRYDANSDKETEAIHRYLSVLEIQPGIEP
jgi:hypothetical protein